MLLLVARAGTTLEYLFLDKKVVKLPECTEHLTEWLGSASICSLKHNSHTAILAVQLVHCTIIVCRPLIFPVALASLCGWQ